MEVKWLWLSQVLGLHCAHGCHFRTQLFSPPGWPLPSHSSEPLVLPKLSELEEGALRLQLTIKEGVALSASELIHLFADALEAPEVRCQRESFPCAKSLALQTAAVLSRRNSVCESWIPQ